MKRTCRIFQAVFSSFVVGVAIVCSASPLWAVDRVTANIDEVEKKLEGRILAVDDGGNIFLETRDGQWHMIRKKDIIDQTSDDKEFQPYTKDEMKKRLTEEFPKEFHILETKRYLVVYDTSKTYAQWCAALLERLGTAFLAHWKTKGFELNEPEFVLVAVIFADRGNFLRCTASEVGSAVDQIAAYYNQYTNRVVFYDLTGQERDGASFSTKTTGRRMREILSRPESARAVSTFVHEATHQISFNSGLQKRSAANPLWVSEGIATLFETPNYDSQQAWTPGIKLNLNRLGDLFSYLDNRRPEDPIRKVVVSDEPFQIITSPYSAVDAYATAWSMMFYFNARRPKDLVKYMKIISAKKPFVPEGSEQRIRDFEEAFGNDWDKLLKDYYKFVRSL
ncbi:MAG: DUF1570 domain-containing protein [Planctomycetaceae bacterium]|nr:DUF1570 domain-containing protein [Planctomycetaceae bacterium]